jgi:NADPH-dependent 7-cyano-7-deazaguanine reductase QueF
MSGDGLMELVTLGAASGVHVSATFQATHRCPVREEVDRGVVTVVWTTHGSTLELALLADLIASYADERITHEGFVADLWETVAAVEGISALRVLSSWRTAGGEIDVEIGTR